MKIKVSAAFDILIESVNYVVISYALSNIAILFRTNLLYILFLASEIWITGNYWQRVYAITQNKWIASLLLALCFTIHIGIIFFFGHVVETAAPFQP